MFELNLTFSVCRKRDFTSQHSSIIIMLSQSPCIVQTHFKLRLLSIIIHFSLWKHFTCQFLQHFALQSNKNIIWHTLVGKQHNHLVVEINDLWSRRLQYFKSAMETLKFAHAWTEDGLFVWKSRIYCKDTFKTRKSNLKGRWFERLGDFLDNLQ